MAVIPQVVTSDRATGAQVIDGSLKFDQTKKTYLTRTPGSAGNRKLWTLSYWIKFYGDVGHLFSANNDAFQFELRSTGQLLFANSGSTSGNTLSTSRFRDYGQFYHVVIQHDAANTIARFYINGEQNFTATLSDADGTWNNATSHNINGRSTSIDSFSSFGMSQVYFVDGMALGPGYFGFTDPLTNTWRPKKFRAEGTTVNDGRVFSSTGTFSNWNTGSYPKTELFDGVVYTGGTPNGASTNGAATAASFDFGDQQITGFQNLQINIFISSNQASATNLASVNGIDITDEIHAAGNNTWTTVDLGSKFTTLKSFTLKNYYCYVGGFIVDGVVMKDSTTQNLDFGTNGFYLPMDGNSPIGQDKSGKGNNWTPVNFGGSVALDSPAVSGARPILNTTPGGTQATVGVFGSKQNVGYAVTVYDDGGGNKYYIDGVKTASITGLIRGATYTFDTSDSTVSSHPFRLSATSNGSWGGGSEYTNGVAAITGAATTITVPYDAPETLYYYCTSHSGMGNASSISGITTNEKLADQYASNVTLALPLVGDDDDVCASIACTANNKTPTNSSVTAATTHSNFYSGSHYWSANSDTLQYAQQGNELVFGSGDYTIECWLYDDNGHNGTGNRCYIFDNRIGGSVVGDPPTMTGYIDSHNEFNFGDGTNTITHTVPSTVGKWWHYAVSREGTTTRMFIDGILRGSATSSTNFTNNGIGVGRATDANYGFAGYIQDFRVYTGVAKYTSNFVPAATSPDILPDTPSGVSGSSKLTKITDGAVAFDGTNDTLSVPDHADFTFGSGDFTMEAFVYTKGSGYRSIVQKYGGAPATSSWFWTLYNGQNSLYYYSGGNEPSVTSGKTHYNKWVHCAVSREGNTIRIFDDGELTGTLDVSSYATMNDSTVPIDIGADYANNYDMDGFISNVRIVKGTALYTKSFTAPSAPLTNVTNTKLLCCQSNASAGAAAVSPQISGLNSGTVWSDYLTTTQGANSRDFYTVASNPASNLFDGDTSTIVYGGWTDDADDNSDLIFSPPSGISVSSKLEVYVGYYSKIKVNGADYNTGGQSTAQAWVTVSDGSNFTGTLTELILENTSNANVVRAAAIRIDDSTILLDPVLQQGNAVATTFNPFITDINTVRGQETGYPTLNPLFRSGTYSDGNLVQTTTSGNGHYRANIGITTSSGKFYFEYQPTGSNVPGMVGLVEEGTPVGNNLNGTTAYSYYGTTGNKQGSPSNVDTSYGATFTFGDVIGVAFDSDNGGSLEYFKNGVSQGVAFSNEFPNFPYFPAFSAGSSSNTTTYNVNFGQKPFKYAPPDGFQPINAANTRPVKVIPRSDQFFGLTTYTGNGGTQSINVGLKPDFVWIKRRNSSGDHQLYDSVRGANKGLTSDQTLAEWDYGNGLTAFDPKGFTLGALGGANASNDTHVAWTWKAGGNKNTFNVDDVGYASAAAAGLTGGSITPTGASVGTKQGFSIIKYTGTLTGTPGSGSMPTVPHGLQKAPSLVIAKATVMDAGHDGGDWFVWHHSTNLDFSLDLNLGAAGNAISSQGGGTMVAPTTSVFSTPYLSGINAGTGSTYIAYFWHDVPGLQKFGTYSGNSSTDGPFIELGFRPALFVMKQTDSTGYWMVYDSARDPINSGSPYYLFWNDTSAQGTGYDLDFLSNGVKLRTDNANFNTTSYVYMAWAEAPTVDLFGGGANAR